MPHSSIVLDRDLPDHGLRKGDLDAVVEVYEPDGLEVEFVTASGRTAAVLTLTAQDVLRIREAVLSLNGQRNAVASILAAFSSLAIP